MSHEVEGGTVDGGVDEGAESMDAIRPDCFLAVVLPHSLRIIQRQLQ
eukprot:SAG11_NODE_2740_length_3022_cov_2.199795_2_plen_47_part_00